MNIIYLGRLSEHDPLHGYLQHDIQPQISGASGSSGYRVFRLNGSNDVYLYEDRNTGTKLIGKFFLSSRKKVALTQGFHQGVRRFRPFCGNQQMDMIGHQHVGMNAATGLVCVFA